MTTVYLVRHAKSIGNTERIFQGRSNLGLSAEGRAQLPQLQNDFGIFLWRPYTPVLSSGPYKRLRLSAIITICRSKQRKI